ncbi:hypothetical protein [Saccharothrix sp. HUAS TT1]|uniref:hypothetical protein n=1 Tax=unclassified Saccharothrix TaxID=2593673 RepID=UPI00345BA5B3
MVDALRAVHGPPAATPLPFRVDDRELLLPDLATRTWLEALVLEAPGCWWRLLPGALDPDDADWLTGRLVDLETADGDDSLWRDAYDLDDLEDAALAVLGAALGMDFWVATRLAGTAWANWMAFDGWCFARGVDPLREPIGRLLTGVYRWRLSLCQKDSEVAVLDAEVFAPAPGVRMSGRSRDAAPLGWSAQREEAAFMQAFAGR